MTPQHNTPDSAPMEADASLSGTLQTVTLVIAGAALLLAPYLYVYSASPLNSVAPLWIAFLALSCFALVRSGRPQLAPYLMVFGVLIGAVVSVVAHGSLRYSGVGLFVAIVAGAGIFLGRTAFLVSVVLSTLALMALLWAEQSGLMTASRIDADFSALLTHLVTMYVVAIMVYHSRRRTQDTHRRLLEELNAHRKTEAERDRNLQRFERIFQSSPTPMIAQSAKSGVILDVNAAFERCYGYRREQVLGRVEDFLWADPGQRKAHMKRLFNQFRSTDQPATGLRSDGSHFEALLSSEISADKDDTLIISNVIDVSDQIRHETLLMEMAQGMTTETGEAFFHALARHMAPALNADAVMVSEKVTDTRLRSLSIWQFGHQLPNFSYAMEGTPCQPTLIRYGLCAYERDLQGRFPGLPKTLSPDFQAYAGQGLHDEEGGAMGVLSAYWRQPTPMTTELQALMAIFSSRATAELVRMRREREIQRLNHTLEQRVRARTAELQKLNAELDSFSYSVSHDLKSPLRAIDGFTRLLGDELEDRLKPHERQLLDRVIGATQRMSVLIADLLALARVSQGALAPALTNLSALAEEILRAEQEKHPLRRLHWQIEPGLQAWCDPRLTRIALENLLGNAVKYTRDQAEPRITLGRETGVDGSTEHLFIQDNGVGFDMAYASKLFQPFQRLHQPSEFDGTGIGLATVRRILERHGGGIEGVGKPGEGARFVFHFGPAPKNPATPAHLRQDSAV